MDDVRWLDEREQRAWKALQLMQMQVDGELARRLAAESDLSNPDYAVLAGLTDQPDGRMRLFEIGSALGWEKSRLSHHIARMVKRGLVVKEPCDEDRRGAFVVVTPRGRREIEAAAPGHVRAVRDVFLDHVSADQLDVIAATSEAVLAALAGHEPCD